MQDEHLDRFPTSIERHKYNLNFVEFIEFSYYMFPLLNRNKYLKLYLTKHKLNIVVVYIEFQTAFLLLLRHTRIFYLNQKSCLGDSARFELKNHNMLFVPTP